jgi:hypothetical protein
VVDDMLMFEPPAPVHVIEESSQPSRLVPIEPASSFAPRPRRLRPHERFTPPPSSPALPARAVRVVPRERGRATTAPLEEPHAGPSTVPGPSTPSPSTTLAAGMRSPPPRYEYPFYPVVVAPARSTRLPLTPPPSSPNEPRGEAATLPPSYTGPYTPLSPPPPPPYNSLTDCATVIAARFDEPVRISPLPPAHRRLSAIVEPDDSSDDEPHAPGMWPTRRRLPSPDFDMGEPEHEPEERGGVASVLGRMFGGFFR